MTRLQRHVNLAAVVVPLLAIIAAVPLLRGSLLGLSDLVVFAVMYVMCGFGVTVGHRMRTPVNSSKTPACDASTAFPMLILASLLLPALLGFTLTGTLHGALTGLLRTVASGVAPCRKFDTGVV